MDMPECYFTIIIVVPRLSLKSLIFCRAMAIAKVPGTGRSENVVPLPEVSREPTVSKDLRNAPSEEVPLML